MSVFLIDVINDLDFNDSGDPVAEVEPSAVRLSVLKRRAEPRGAADAGRHAIASFQRR
jgi:hypothetical protein